MRLEINLPITGGGAEQKAAEIRNINAALREHLELVTRINAAGNIGSMPTGNASAANARAGVLSTGNASSAMMPAAVAQHAQAISGITTSAAASGREIDNLSRKISGLKRELQDLERIANTPGGRLNASHFNQQADALRSQLQAAQAQQQSAIAARDYRYNMQRIRPGEEFGAAWHRGGLSNDQFDSDNAAFNRRAHASRIRPGEEMEAAAHRAQLDEERRQQAAQRRAFSDSRRQYFDDRRTTGDLWMAGGIATGAGAALLAPVGYGVGQYAQSQLTRIGVQAQEGANTGNVTLLIPGGGAARDLEQATR